MDILYSYIDLLIYTLQYTVEKMRLKVHLTQSGGVRLYHGNVWDYNNPKLSLIRELGTAPKHN